MTVLKREDIANFISMEWNLLAAIIPIMMQNLLQYYGII